MNLNNWVSPQARADHDQPPTIVDGDWRSRTQAEYRKRIVNEIMETLKRKGPFSGQEGLKELNQLAMRLEEKMFRAATNQTDYLRKISLMMLKMEPNKQNTLPKALPSNLAVADMSRTTPDIVPSQDMQSQQRNQGQSPFQMVPTQSQARQQLLAMRIQNNLASAATQTSANLPNSLPPVSGLKQKPMSNVAQIPNSLNISASQNLMENTMNQGIASNMFTNARRQMQGRQHTQQVDSQQKPRHSQNPHPYNNQQQFLHQIWKEKLEQGFIQQPLTQTPIQQQRKASQQQKKMRQRTQLPSVLKSSTLLKCTKSSFIPSPSTPSAPSPVPGKSEKPTVSSLSNTTNLAHEQTSGAPAAPQLLSIGTPEISPSPFFDCSGPDGTHADSSTVASGNSNVTEQPFERLLKAVKSISPKALDASVDDIGSVVSMIDRIAGSAPGNGSTTKVGEDLVARTKCHVQAENFLARDGYTATKRMRRFTNAMPLNDSLKQLTMSGHLS